MPLKPLQPSPTMSEEIHIERERLTSLVNSMADGVIATDRTGKVVVYNAAALSLLDRNTSIKGLVIGKVLHLMDKDKQPVDVESLVRNSKIQQSIRDFLMHYDSDNSIINIFLSISPVYLGYGQSDQGGHVILLRDITKEKSLEEERDEFISVTSHELRTPIAIAEGNVSNALYVLDKGADISQIKQALKTTHDQILFLTDLINDLATLSRAERGTLAASVESINVHNLVTELVNNYTDQAAAKSLTLKADIDPKLEVLQSSTLYVREVLQNYITNAIKYTDHGGITIGARSKNGGVLFEVSDTGIGISKSDQAKIFGKFFRSEDYRTRQHNGTGLGLYVTKKLASLLRAEITVDSKLNHGSTFSIFVPNMEQPVDPKK